MRHLQVGGHSLSWPGDISGKSDVEEELDGYLEMQRKLLTGTLETMLKDLQSLYRLEEWGANSLPNRMTTTVIASSA